MSKIPKRNAKGSNTKQFFNYTLMQIIALAVAIVALFAANIYSFKPAITSMPQSIFQKSLAYLPASLLSNESINISYNVSMISIPLHPLSYSFSDTLQYERRGNLSRLSVTGGQNNFSIFDFNNTYYLCSQVLPETQITCRTNVLGGVDTNGIVTEGIPKGTNVEVDVVWLKNYFNSYFSFINISNLQLITPIYSANFSSILSIYNVGQFGKANASSILVANTIYSGYNCTNFTANIYDPNASGNASYCMHSGMPLAYNITLSVNRSRYISIMNNLSIYNSSPAREVMFLGHINYISDNPSKQFILPEYITKYIYINARNNLTVT